MVSKINGKAFHHSSFFISNKRNGKKLCFAYDFSKKNHVMHVCLFSKFSCK